MINGTKSEQIPKEAMVAEQEVVDMSSSKKANKVIYGVFLILILLGVGTGYMLFRAVNGGSAAGTTKVTQITNSDKVFGVNDTTTFKDPAEGIIEKGGVDGEGTHKLLREGGPSQTVALVSSILDLDDFVGKKVKVWGQTFPPQKAGWFMDIGKIELLE